MDIEQEKEVNPWPVIWAMLLLAVIGLAIVLYGYKLPGWVGICVAVAGALLYTFSYIFGVLLVPDKKRKEDEQVQIHAGR